jgi:osmoprotectant transport system permease protein
VLLGGDPQAALAGGNCLVQNAWLCGRYLSEYGSTIVSSLISHVLLTAVSVGIGTALSLPLAVAAYWWRPVAPGVLGIANVAYTIPSLALFALLVPLTGLTAATVVVGLVIYTLVILVRNTLTGLYGVPAEVRDAARGMGYGRWRMLGAVELPLAAPAVFAGLRVATVSTVALVTVGAVIDHGGLGNLLDDAITTDFKAEALTATVLCVALAVALDLLLGAAQRLAEGRFGGRR